MIFSSKSFSKSDFITKCINSFSEIKIMDLVKGSELIFDNATTACIRTFWSHSFLLVFSCVLVLDYVLNTLLRI